MEGPCLNTARFDRKCAKYHIFIATCNMVCQNDGSDASKPNISLIKPNALATVGHLFEKGIADKLVFYQEFACFPLLFHQLKANTNFYQSRITILFGQRI